MRGVLLFILLFSLVSSAVFAMECSDSDGLDIFKKGSVTKGALTFHDVCTDSNTDSHNELESCDGSLCFVKEWYCNTEATTETAADVIVGCTEGCKDGACQRLSDAPCFVSTDSSASIRHGHTFFDHAGTCPSGKLPKLYVCLSGVGIPKSSGDRDDEGCFIGTKSCKTQNGERVAAGAYYRDFFGSCDGSPKYFRCIEGTGQVLNDQRYTEDGCLKPAHVEDEVFKDTVFVIDEKKDDTVALEYKECDAGAQKIYTCSNGLKGGWCSCSDGGWNCAEAEKRCGDLLSDEGECEIGSSKPFICPDESEVEWCACLPSGKWACLSNPQQLCEGFSDCNSGCSYEGKCLAFGQRISGDADRYCDIDGLFSVQKENEEACQNSYECISNVCTNGNCGVPCNGCSLEGRCIDYGTRIGLDFCDIDGNIKVQVRDDQVCSNNYECTSNLCVSNQCLSQNFIRKLFSWVSKFLVRIP